MNPGIAKISRFILNPNSAVINAPPFLKLSATKIPSDIPAIIRFLLGKVHLVGCVPNGYSLTIVPFSAILSHKPRLS